MPTYIKTVGDFRRRLSHLDDDEPVEFWLNAVETQAYFQQSGENGGDPVNIAIEPNYTCQPSTQQP